jgi:hypothetical protein
MQTDRFRNSADDVTGLHRQSFVRRRDPFENALGEHTIRMKRLTAADGGAEPDWQRRDVRSLHGLRVPAKPIRKTHCHGFNNGDSGH